MKKQFLELPLILLIKYLSIMCIYHIVADWNSQMYNSLIKSEVKFYKLNYNNEH